MISHKHKFIYVNIGKCGSVSVNRSIRRCAKDYYIPDDKKNKGDIWRHSTAEQIIDHYGADIWNEYFTFAVVRNPWDRLVSMFHFNIKGRWITHHCDPRVTRIRKECRRFLRKHSRCKKIAFLDYAKNHIHRKPQYEYVCDSSGNVLVDSVFKLEDLSTDYSLLSSKLGLPDLKLGHANKTSRGSYSEYYDSDSVAAVADIYSEDINKFGYEFLE